VYSKNSSTRKIEMKNNARQFFGMRRDGFCDTYQKPAEFNFLALFDLCRIPPKPSASASHKDKHPAENPLFDLLPFLLSTFLEK